MRPRTLALIAALLWTVAPSAPAQQATDAGRMARLRAPRIVLPVGVGATPLPAVAWPDSATPHRSPMVAGFLGVFPGLGHVYANEPARGALVSFIWFTSGLVMFGSDEPSLANPAAVVNLGAYVFSIADGALAAERFNKRHQGRTTSR